MSSKLFNHLQAKNGFFGRVVKQMETDQPGIQVSMFSQSVSGKLANWQSRPQMTKRDTIPRVKKIANAGAGAADAACRKASLLEKEEGRR